MVRSRAPVASDGEIRLCWGFLPSAGSGCDRRSRHEQAREQALVSEKAVAEERVGDIGLDHEMEREPATREQGRAIERPHAPDRVAIPETGKSGSGAELRFLLHAVPADELAAFPREHAHRGLSDSEKALKSFKGRLRANQHGMERTDRSRTELIKCGTLARGIRVLPLVPE